jgi:hypothetical protein
MRHFKPAERPSATAPHTTAIDWLRSDGMGANVLTTARQMLDIERAIKSGLSPALAAYCRVARLEGQSVMLAVPSAAYAAKLRQLTPRIVQSLAQQGWNLNQIDIRVQASLTRNETQLSRPKDVNPLDDAALQSFEQLLGHTQGPLAQAVQRLLARHGKKG